MLNMTDFDEIFQPEKPRHATPVGEVLSHDKARNKERLDNYKERVKQNKLITYAYEGQEYTAVGSTEQHARQRAAIACNGDDFKVINVEPLEGWMNR
jgi:hypothetical protein